MKPSRFRRKNHVLYQEPEVLEQIEKRQSAGGSIMMTEGLGLSGEGCGAALVKMLQRAIANTLETN